MMDGHDGRGWGAGRGGEGPCPLWRWGQTETEDDTLRQRGRCSRADYLLREDSNETVGRQRGGDYGVAVAQLNCWGPGFEWGKEMQVLRMSNSGVRIRCCFQRVVFISRMK